MQIDLKIDKESVERAVTDAIVQSAIGDRLKQAVTNLLSKSWDNPIDKATEAVIREVAMQKVRELFSDMIEAEVKKRMTEEAVSEFVGRFWDGVFKG